jgi:HEAT repeat protein
MGNPDEIRRLIEEVRADPACDAFRRLSRAGQAALPEIAAAAKAEKSIPVRAKLIEALWRQADASMVPLFKDWLDDPSELVWKEALNGLVSVANEDAHKVLKAALKKLGRKGDPQRIEWYNEGLDQIQEIQQENEDNFLG